MKLLQVLILVFGLAFSAQAFMCWVCENVADNDECLQKGHAQLCQPNEDVCHNEVRRGSFGIMITKRCKQAHACDNNFVQNPRAAWFPAQCNSRTPSSVCRCCCNSNDLCNRDSVDCFQAKPRGPEDDFCDHIRTPQNGRKECKLRDIILPESDKVGVETECQFTCNQGYRLVGDPQSTCDLDPETQRAKFNRPSPRCTPAICNPSQTSPTNGDVTCTDGNAVGSVCSFHCDQGSELVGETATLCLTSGLWSARAPRCRRAQCVPPHADPRNGLATCDNFNYLGSTCRFECSRGFFLEGSSASRCQADGNNNAIARWSTEAPRCRPITCIPQEAPSNGNIVCTDDANLDSVCQFTCNFGFALIGNDVTTCFDDDDGDEQGLWTSPPPSCQPITCHVQVAPSNGVVLCTDGNNLNSVCQFSCNSGFARIGNDATTCLDDGNNDLVGQWTLPPPQCQPITCNEQVAPSNGRVLCTDSNNLDSVCQFSCNSGFALVGNDAITCFDDGNNDVIGQWTSPPPQCQPIRCVEQVAPTNGGMLCTDSNNLDSVCQFSCNFGFVFVGNEATTCLDDENNDVIGQWTSPPPECQPIRCSDQVAPPNGNIICSDGNNLNSACRFTCNNGFDLIGTDNNLCVDDGNSDFIPQWTSSPPVCQQIVCPTLKAPANGNISCTNENLFASACSFACDNTQGFALFPVEMTQSVCRRDGDWDRPIPCCARSCPPFAIMDLVLVLDSSSSIGDDNWDIMTAFIRSFIESFEFSAEFSQLSVIRYNAQVDTDSQILFNSYVENRAGLLAAYDAIPYDGSGTRTGQALQYVSDFVLTEENGDRPEVQDIILVITDGRAQDGDMLRIASDDLRFRGAITYAIGIRPTNGRLDRAQLEEIGGSPENVFVAESGFEGLGELLQNQLSEEVCENRCGEEQ